jgi:hypothetical protein
MARAGIIFYCQNPHGTKKRTPRRRDAKLPQSFFFRLKNPVDKAFIGGLLNLNYSQKVKKSEEFSR